jgi:hypothetical protein
MPYDVCNGPGLEGALAVSTTPILLKVGASALEERAMVSIQPTNGVIYYGYTSSVTSLTGTKVFKNQLLPLEATSTLTVYLVAASGTVDVRITEKA